MPGQRSRLPTMAMFWKPAQSFTAARQSTSSTTRVSSLAISAARSTDCHGFSITVASAVVAVVSACRSHTAGDAEAPSRTICAKAPGHGEGDDVDLCRHVRGRGALCPYLALRRHPAWRSRRHHLLEPDRIFGNCTRLRLARRYCCSDQRRIARTAASAHLVELRRAAAGDGSGLW